MDEEMAIYTWHCDNHLFVVILLPFIDLSFASLKNRYIFALSK
jgi:hypothetical protein